MKMKSFRKSFPVAFFPLTLAFIVFLEVGCCPVLKKEAQWPEEALRQVRFFFPEFSDDMDRDSLILAVRRNTEYLDRLGPETIFRYGSDDFTIEQVRESQEAFLDLLAKGLDPDHLSREIRKKFRVYRATGRVKNRKVLFTGYYEPIYEGSLAPDPVFKYPLYRSPDDLIRIDLSLFSEKFKGENIVARIQGKKVLPYYSRHQIEWKGASRKGLEMAWLKTLWMWLFSTSRDQAD
jgi:membrane-bound lytic murein transglycosylase A